MRVAQRDEVHQELSHKIGRLRRTTSLIAAAWAAVLIGAALWIGTTPNAELRDELRRWQFWFLEAQFVLLVALTVANIGSLVRWLGLARVDYLAMSGAAVLAIVLAGGVAPLTNRIYYDEQIYQGIGQNFTDLRLAQMCNDGTVEYGSLQCWRGEYNKQPYGYPYVLSVVYRLAGVGYWTGARLNVLVDALFVVLVYTLARALFEDRRAARAAALIAVLIPQQLLWSHTAAAEPSAAVAGLVAVTTAVYFVQTATTRALLWAVVATVFAMQFRAESILLAPIVVLIVARWNPTELRAPRFWIVSLLGAVLALALIGHLVAVRNEGWGASGDRFSIEYLVHNIRTNGTFYIADWRFPAVFTGLALCAVAFARQRWATLLLLVYFSAFFGVYLLFYAGSYNYGADVRYSLMTYPPLAVLAGAGAVTLMRVGHWFGVTPARAEIVGAALLGAQFLWYTPLVRAVGEEAWAARADIAFSQRVMETLPRNAIVLTHNPSVFHVAGHNAAQLSLIANEPPYVRNVLLSRYSGGVYVHWNFWCNVDDKRQQEFCRAALQRFPTALVTEYRERDYRYAFYRLLPEAASAATSTQNDGGPGGEPTPLPR